MEEKEFDRKQLIEKYVDVIYNDDRINFLYTDPIGKFKQYALDLFLDTNLTREQIADGFRDITLERLKIYTEKKRLEQREQDIRNVVAEIYNQYADLFYVSLIDMQNQHVELYLNNDSISIEDIREKLMNTVMELKERKKKTANVVPPIVKTEPITSPVVQYEAVTTPVVKTENIDMPIEEVKNESISSSELETIDAPVQESVAEGNELSTMLEENPEKSDNEVVTNEINKPKQFVKTNDGNNSNDSGNPQSGSVSIFAIGVTILSIISFILIAMILNVLLK